MIKKIIIASAMVGAVGMANAATRCVALNEDTVCDAGEEETVVLGSPNWDATCVTNGVSVAVRGIGVCAQERPYTNNGVLQNVTMGTDSNGGVSCWCKMIEPVETQWIGFCHLSYALDPVVCNQVCGRFCAIYLDPNWGFSLDDGIMNYLEPRVCKESGVPA